MIASFEQRIYTVMRWLSLAFFAIACGGAFTPPYAYTLDRADDVPTLVESTVGPR